MERALALLAPGGRLVALTPNRWLKRDYGRALRALVETDFALDTVIDAERVPVFDRAVQAYPAISVIRRGAVSGTLAVTLASVDAPGLAGLARDLKSAAALAGPPTSNRSAIRGAARGAIVRTAPDEIHEIVRGLEARLPSLAEVGCKVGIGPTTGRDAVFIRPFAGNEVECERMLPLVTPACLRDGEIAWRGLGLMNPFDAGGQLVGLAEWPHFARCLAPHRDELAARPCVKSPGASDWYRTNDPVYADLHVIPKLLLPEAARSAGCWAPIPIQGGRPFRSMLGTDSN